MIQINRNTWTAGIRTQIAICDTGKDSAESAQSEALMRRVILVLVVAGLLSPACGGDPETETFASTPEPDLSEAIRSNTATDPDNQFSDEETDCIVDGIVDEFGEDGLAELGVTPDNPDLEGGAVFTTPETARRAVDVAMECIDIANTITANLPADTNLLESSVDCVADQLQTDPFRDLFAEVIAAGGEPTDILSDGGAQLSIGALLLTCLSPEELLRVNELLP